MLNMFKRKKNITKDDIDTQFEKLSKSTDVSDKYTDDEILIKLEEFKKSGISPAEAVKWMKHNNIPLGQQARVVQRGIDTFENGR